MTNSPCCRRSPAGDAVAFLARAPIDAAALTAQVRREEHGGIATFVGSVRNHHRGREVVALEYTAYEAMAERVSGEIVGEASARWPIAVAMAHRIGALEVGDTAIVVAVGAAHRGAAFDACRWIVDEVKRRVPIWKRERYSDGSEEWVDPGHATESSADATR